MAEKKPHKVPEIPTPPPPVEPPVTLAKPAASKAEGSLPPADLTRSGPAAARANATPAVPVVPEAQPQAQQHGVPAAEHSGAPANGQSPYGQPGQQTPARPNPYATSPGYVQPNPYAPQIGYAPQAGYMQQGDYVLQSYAPQPYAPGPPKGLSIASMVLGIVGLLFSFAGVGFLLVVAAVITGHLAHRRQPAARPFWLTGIITGYIGLGFSFLWGTVIAIALVASFSNI